MSFEFSQSLEEGKYDFTGQKDIGGFLCRLAAGKRNVCDRSSRTVCLCGSGMGDYLGVVEEEKTSSFQNRIRIYGKRVEIVYEEVGKQLTDLQISKGGNNAYGTG